MTLGRSGLIFAAASALLALASVPVQAQMTCGGNDFATCASVTITAVTDVGNGQVVINMVVTNNSGANGTFAGTTFTDIGLFGLGNFSYVSGSLATTGSGSWVLGPNGLSGAGIQPNVAGVEAGTPQPQNGLKANETVNITFRITGVTAGSIDLTDWAIKGATGPNGCSTKLVVTNGVPNNGPFSEQCGSATVSPEPASVALMGTGLMGLGAGAWARRRRKV